MKAQNRELLERLRDDLRLHDTKIGDLLSGHMPDDAAVECAASESCLGFALRVSVSACKQDQSMLALERFIGWLNRREQTVRWEIRRRRQRSTVEIWLVSLQDRTESTEPVEAMRKLHARLAVIARRERSPFTALCQPVVAATLNGFLRTELQE